MVNITLERVLHWAVMLILVGMVYIHFADKDKINALYQQLQVLNTQIEVANNNNTILTQQIEKQNGMLQSYHKMSEEFQGELNCTIDDLNKFKEEYCPITNQNADQKEAMQWLQEKSADF